MLVAWSIISNVVMDKEKILMYCPLQKSAESLLASMRSKKQKLKTDFSTKAGSAG